MRVLTTTYGQVKCVAFSADGTHLFASGHAIRSEGNNGGICLFALAGGTEPVTHFFLERAVPWLAAPLGDRLVAFHTGIDYETSLDWAVSTLDWRTGHERRVGGRLNHPCGVSAEGRLIALSFVPTGVTAWGRTLVTQAAEAWALPADGDPHMEWQQPLGTDRNLRGIALAPGGRSVWTVEWNPSGRIEIIPRDAGTGAPTRGPIAFPKSVVRSIQFAPTGAVAVVHLGPALFVYDSANPDQTPRKLTNPANRKHFSQFAFHPSGNWLAAAGLDGAVTVWDTATWKVTKSWNWGAGQMRSLCFSPDGALAAAGTSDGTVVVWDLDL